MEPFLEHSNSEAHWPLLTRGLAPEEEPRFRILLRDGDLWAPLMASKLLTLRSKLALSEPLRILDYYLLSAFFEISGNAS